jgi:hypothetical protein
VNDQETQAEAQPASQTAQKRDGCFYTVNTLMILLFAIPVLVLLVVGVLKVLGWIFPEQP